MLKFFKGDPNTYYILFRNGRSIKEGLGLNLWYLPMVSTISAIPTGSADTPFIYSEKTRDFQEVVVQGTLNYRMTDTGKLARLLDFTIDPESGSYLTEEPDKVVNRIITAVQDLTRAQFAAFPLKEALRAAREVADQVTETVNAVPDLEALGIVVDSIHITSLRATPEMQKALEAEYREKLQLEADQAIYARRASAVEEERKIKERELSTDIELENQRQKLVDTQARNTLASAEAKAKAEGMKLDLYTDMPPQALVGLALKEWADGGGTVSNLSIAPDILAGMANWLTAPKNREA